MVDASPVVGAELFGALYDIVTAAGITPRVERFVRLARGFSEGMIEAWANLYTEFAMAVAVRQDGIKPPPDWLDFPGVEDGARGVQFVDAAVKSNESGGTWVEIASPIDALVQRRSN